MGAMVGGATVTRAAPSTTQRSMADAQPLTVQSVARGLQQRRQSRGTHVSRRDLRVVPDIARLLGRSTQETCQFLGRKDVRGCYEPRSCRDCLQRDGCMVSGYTCISEDLYVPAIDYRRVGFDGNYSTISNASIINTDEPICYWSRFPKVFFPSSTAEYCLASDSACPQSHITGGFRNDIESRVSSYKSESKYCVGVNNCVCIGACEEAAVFSQLADQSHCRLASPREDSISYIILVGSMLGLALSIMMTVFWRKESRERINASRDGQTPAASHSASATVRGLRRNMLDAAPALHLDLYGWRFFQNEILRKEEELLAGAHDVSPVARPMAFEFAAIPTAPDFEEEDESTAPTITNPHALASAPVFQLQKAGDSADRRLAEDAGIPSAPDFE